MRRILRGLAPLAGVALCAGIGLAGWTTATPIAHAQQPSASQLSAALLTLNDLPAGLEVDTIGATGFVVTCSGQRFFAGSSTNVEADFVASDRTVALASGLSAYAPGGAAADLAAGATLPQATGCMVATSDGSQDSISFTPLDFPTIADQTLAFSFTFSISGTQVPGDWVVVQHGDILEITVVIDLTGNGVNQATTELVARAADMKLSATLP